MADSVADFSRLAAGLAVELRSKASDMLGFRLVPSYMDSASFGISDSTLILPNAKPRLRAPGT